MHLDGPSLILMTVLITAVIGALFLLSWTQTRSTPALLWWGCGEILASVAIALLGARSVVPGIYSIVLANTFLLTAYGMPREDTWT